jgi:hypothetical protein
VTLGILRGVFELTIDVAIVQSALDVGGFALNEHLRTTYLEVDRGRRTGEGSFSAALTLPRERRTRSAAPSTYAARAPVST